VSATRSSLQPIGVGVKLELESGSLKVVEVVNGGGSRFVPGRRGCLDKAAQVLT